MKLDNRNVADHFKYWENDAIKAALDEVRLPFICVVENFAHDFNIGTVIRNLNAFTGKELWVVGRKKYDKRGTVGTHNYEHIHKVDTIDEVFSQYPDYWRIALELTDDAVDINTWKWPEKSIMVFGQESLGITEETLSKCHKTIYIPQRGSTRSLNVGVASGIAMYSYTQCYDSGKLDYGTPS